MACISPQSSFSSVAIEDWLQVPKLTVPFPDFKDTDFKYRFWLTRHIMNDPESTSAWLATIEGKESDEDMWLWEDVDEEFIKAALRPFPGDCEVKFPELDWVLACNALAARNLRTPTQKLLTHLSSQTRIRIISWFIFAGPWRRERLRRGDPQSLDTLIERWGNLLYIGTELYIGNVSAIAYGNCRNCRASHFVPLWVETMLEVCFLDDLKLIPWSAGCACFERQFSLSAKRVIPQIRIQNRPVALRILYELVVPPWPLILWLTFRTVLDVQPDPLETFLSFLYNSPPDLFAWDDEDDSYLTQALLQHSPPFFHGPSIYPGSWRKYIREIAPKHWLLIQNMTWTISRPRRGIDNTARRIRSLVLLFKFASGYPCLSISLDRILVPLGITSGILPPMFRCITGNQSQPRNSANFDPSDFWVDPTPEHWLTEQNEELCRSVWIARTSFLERIECMHCVLGILPQNLAMYTHSFILKQSRRVMDKLQEISEQSQDILESLISYYSVVDSLFGFLKQSCNAKDSKASHIISKTVYDCMNRDISVLVARLVTFLRDSGSYKRFLASRGARAQNLLDLLQDLLDHDGFSVVRPLLFKVLLRLSRDSGLHPHCFPISGLQKVGQQVTAGGFGDIWKGLVRGQSVSVKIMRLFQDEDIEAALKEFGREALIWRQLCHPNLLPFFGLYYLDSRLCLVSPWMVKGNIMQFLSKEPHDVNRFSLILDVALGLEYLHENHVVHGDLKALNILVTPSRRACIADFGLSSIVNTMTLRFTHSSTNVRGGTARYQSPELFRGESQSYFGSDVYAFACVCYEILTGKVPFYEVLNEMTVMFKVVEGKRPTRLISCSGTTAFDSLWDLLESCWKAKPIFRPTATQIVDRLLGPSIGATTTHSMKDWDETFSSKFRRSVQGQPLLPSVTQIEHTIFGDVANACEYCSNNQEPSDGETLDSDADEDKSAESETNASNRGGSERQLKRQLENETSGSDTEDTNPSAKKMKPSP